jgi:virginiamycin B lyase
MNRANTTLSLRALAGTALCALGLSISPALAQAALTEFPAAQVGAAITAGPDGGIWFSSGDGLARIDGKGAVRRLPSLGTNGQPGGIAVGPDGNLWTTASGPGSIARIATAGAINQFPLGSIAPQPWGIASDSLGDLWFTEANSGAIGRITAAGLVVAEYKIPVPTDAAGEVDPPGPVGIVAGADGAIWFTELTAGRIGRVDALGNFQLYRLPSGSRSRPYGLAPGPDGALWFAENGVDKIGRITTDGAISEFVLPKAGSSPQGIASGPDGALWFTETDGDRIGRITTAGAISEFALPAGSGPAAITPGPDGALWFTEPRRLRIGRLTADSTPVAAHTSRARCARSHGRQARARACRPSSARR